MFLPEYLMEKRPLYSEPTYVREWLIAWIREQMRIGGGKKAIIGISGGKDSTIAAALTAAAIGPDNVIGIRLPDGVQKDIDDAVEVCKILKIRSHEVPIGAITGAIKNLAMSVYEAEVNLPEPQIQTMEFNIPPRVRMTQLRAIANVIPGGRLINTSNLSEFYMGYFTKDGDSCGDIFPLLALTKREVVEIGKTLDIPQRLIEKPPADGLTGKTDEDVLGVSYEDIDDYICALENGGVVSRGRCRADAIDKILMKNRAAAHKLTKTPVFFPNEMREKFFRGIK